jgi:hypothetical protein
MYNIIFPANMSIFNSILISVATFDIIPSTEGLYSYVTTLDPVNQKAIGFELLGFENKNFLINTGSLYLFAILFLADAFICYTLKRMAHYHIDFV